MSLPAVLPWMAGEGTASMPDGQVLAFLLQASVKATQELRRRIVHVVRQFELDQMSVRPESISVELDEHQLGVSIHGAICPAERLLACDRQAQDRLERFYRELFDAVKGPLEASIAEILARPIQQSGLVVDGRSGTAFVVFVLGQAQNRNSRKSG